MKALRAKGLHIIILIVFVALAALLFACAETEQSEVFTLRVREHQRTFNFVLDHIENEDFAAIELVYVDRSGNIVINSNFPATLQMVRGQDVPRLNQLGVRTIGLTHEGNTAMVQIRVAPVAELRTFDISFYANGGVFPDAGEVDNIREASVRGAVGSVTINAPHLPFQPSRQGFNFAGWFCEQTNTQLVPPARIEGGREFYARWASANALTINFINNHVPNANGTITVERGDDLTMPCILNISQEPIGFEFRGWIQVPSSGTTVLKAGETVTNVLENLTFHATFAELEFTVTFLLDTGNVVRTVKFGGVVVPPVLPRQTGADAAWVYAVGEPNAGLAPTLTNIQRDMVIDVRFTSITFNVVFRLPSNNVNFPQGAETPASMSAAVNNFYQAGTPFASPSYSGVVWGSSINAPSHIAISGFRVVWFYLNPATGEYENAQSLLNSVQGNFGVQRTINVYALYVPI
jgi:uncharacterized repeat protein (TIGR02543 family)